MPLPDARGLAELDRRRPPLQQGAGPSQMPRQPGMVLVPDKSSDSVLDQINDRRQAALRDKMKYEADYGPCIAKSKSKEEALTCLARWEAAASEYHKAEIEFTAEIERRDLDAIDVWEYADAEGQP